MRKTEIYRRSATATCKSLELYSKYSCKKKKSFKCDYEFQAWQVHYKKKKDHFLKRLIKSKIMYLLTESEGRRGKYLAGGQDVRTERCEVRASRPRAFYHMTAFVLFCFFFLFHFLVERGRAGADRISSRAAPVFPALIRDFFFLWFSKEIARGAVRVIL